MKVYEGTVLTVNRTDDVCRYLAEDGGRILYVGGDLPDSFAGAERVVLGDRALVPAFVDTHQHFASFSTFYAGLNVMDAASNREMAEMIRDFVRRSDSKTLICFGASPYSVEERRLIAREQLDRVCPDREIMVVKYDGHACVINSRLLRRLDAKLKKLRGYHPDTGEMNQEAFFACSDDITRSLSIPQLFRNMQTAADALAAKGIGCIHSVSGVGFAGNLDITMEQVFARSLKNGLQLRIFPQSMNLRVAQSRGLPRIGGCFETALDGCFGSQDAAMLQPYTDGTQGVLYYSDQQVVDFCKRANRAGLQIEMHAIGDRAFDQACRALKAALDDCPRADHRHGIIHDCLPTQEGIDICAEYHIQMPVQSAFIQWKQEPDAYLADILGAERAAALNPLKTFMDRGIVVSAGSDAPCTFPDPIVWMDKAVHHPTQSERLTVQQALRMCTYNGAYAAFDEKERGSLEAGKIADMTLLSGNPYTAGDGLHTLRVEQLLLAGKPYQSCRERIVPAVLRGLTSRSLC